MGKSTGNELKEQHLRSRKTSIAAGVSLLAAAMIFGSGLSAQTGNGEIVVHNQGTMATFAGGTAKSGGQIHVRIDGPDGNNVFEASSESGLIDWALKSDLPDGRYKYDVWFITDGNPVPDKSPSLDPVQQAMYDTAMKADESANKGNAPIYDSGVFLIKGGFIEGGNVHPSNQMGESPDLDLSSVPPAPSRFEQAVGSLLNFLVPAAHADQVIADDLTLQDVTPCLRYEDTTEAGVDWDVCGFDANYGVFDRDTSAWTFWLDNNAPSNSIFVEATTGDVGFGTSTPDTAIQINNTFPNISLVDTDNGNQDYELLTNGGSFFLADRTSGDLPFGMNANAAGSDTFLLWLNNRGVAVGGHTTPLAPLHVRRGDTTGAVLVEETGANTTQAMFRLVNNGQPRFEMTNTNLGESWFFSAFSNRFEISFQGSGGPEMEVFKNGTFKVGPGSQTNLFVKATGDVEMNNGNLLVGGEVTATNFNSVSSITAKDRITDVDADTVLAKLDSLPIREWSYKGVPLQRHVGPMAEDFYATFGLGPDNKHITSTDLAGVALAAAKALRMENQRLQAELDELKQVSSAVARLRKEIDALKLAQ